MPALNPINDPDERKNRHLGYSQRSQALTMRLVEAAAVKAEQALEAPKLPDATTDGDAASEAPPAKPVARTPDPVLGFVRLVRALNQSMAFENRIANDDFARLAHPRHRDRTANTPRPPQDRRRVLLRDAFHAAVKSEPDAAQRRREIDQSIEFHLAADLAQALPVVDILVAVADELDITLDPRKLSDELIGMPPRVYPPDAPPGWNSG